MFVVPKDRAAVQPGERFGRWTVSGFPFWMPTGAVGRNGQNAVCQCECGTVAIVRVGNLRSGKTNSCGCLNYEKVVERATKHGGCGTRLHRIWASMRDRCHNDKSKDWPNYGGRGIGICSEWDRFEDFRDWAMASGYTDGLTIDRIENNAGYSPSNCRFVGRDIQNNNRRNCRFIEAFGERKTLAQWSRDKRCRVCVDTLATRLNSGMNPEAALLTVK